MKPDGILRVGIIGTGWIAEKAAITLNGLKECDVYAVGSRQLEKAETFAKRWHVEKAYGSYTELISDADVDLLYVATPHSHHYDVTREALMAGKPCLVERPSWPTVVKQRQSWNWLMSARCSWQKPSGPAISLS